MSKTVKKKENPLNSIIFNIAIPFIILTKFAKPEYLGQINGLIVALLFPIIFGVVDMIKTKKMNKISLVGLVSITLTGVIGVFKLPPQLIAIKEAAVPALIGIAVLVSAKTKSPLTKVFLMNDAVFDMDKINEHLKVDDKSAIFDKKLYNSTFLLAFSFLVSSILNYVLAKIVVVSEPGSEAFNDEIAKMLALSWPVIVVPSMIVMGVALWYVISNLQKLTGLKLDEMMNK